jgi:hypothetical protein
VKNNVTSSVQSSTGTGSAATATVTVTSVTGPGPGGSPLAEFLAGLRQALRDFLRGVLPAR